MFELNQEYDRQDLLNFVGSKQNQSGVIWGDREPGCVIITSGGKHSISAGYGDIKNKDGSWYYVGQGSKGNQKENNFANSLLLSKQRNILLFSTREPSLKEQRERGNKRKLYRFEGIYDLLSHEFRIPNIGKRKGDKLLVFHLVPASNVFTGNLYLEDAQGLSADITTLRKKIIDTYTGIQTATSTTPRQYKLRSAEVKAYAILRAKGICELCNRAAPFITLKNIPFLEVHHIFKLADDGPDLPHNVAAICPNCHREAHFGINRNTIKQQLITTISAKERN